MEFRQYFASLARAFWLFRLSFALGIRLILVLDAALPFRLLSSESSNCIGEQIHRVILSIRQAGLQAKPSCLKSPPIKGSLPQKS